MYIFIWPFCVCVCVCPSKRRLWEQSHAKWKKDAHGVYQHTTLGTGERVLGEHVSFEAQEDRNRHVFKPVGKTGENLVSKPQGEAQEGGQSDPEERTQRLQVHRRPHRLLQIGGRGVSVPGVCHGGKRDVKHLRLWTKLSSQVMCTCTDHGSR